MRLGGEAAHGGGGAAEARLTRDARGGTHARAHVAGRARCKGCGEKIGQGCVKIGSRFDYPGKFTDDGEQIEGTVWKHAECFTARQWRNVGKAICDAVKADELITENVDISSLESALTNEAALMEVLEGSEAFSVAKFQHTVACKDQALANDAQLKLEKERAKERAKEAKRLEKAREKEAKQLLAARAKQEAKAKKEARVKRDRDAAPPPPPPPAVKREGVPPAPATPAKRFKLDPAAGTPPRHGRAAAPA